MPNRAGPPPVSQRPQATEGTLAVVVREMNNRHDQFAALIGKDHLERWQTVALHALAQNENVLRNCTPISIIEAIRESAALNLSPTGLLGEGWILPYRDVAKFQPGYRGYLKLLRNSGQVKVVDCQIVYMADEFDVEFGTEPKIHHKPYLYGERNDAGELIGDRGLYRGAYAYVRLITGELVIEWMSWDDIDVVRRKSPSVAAGRQSPWDDFPGEMARKTVLRRLMKRLPLDTMPVVAQAATLDEEADIIEGQATEVTPAAQSRATAAAFALARGATDEPSDAPGTSEGVTEASASEPAGPAPVEEGAPCLAESPYGDGEVCRKRKDHPGNHQSPGGTW